MEIEMRAGLVSHYEAPVIAAVQRFWFMIGHDPAIPMEWTGCDRVKNAIWASRPLLIKGRELRR